LLKITGRFMLSSGPMLCFNFFDILPPPFQSASAGMLSQRTGKWKPRGLAEDMAEYRPVGVLWTKNPSQVTHVLGTMSARNPPANSL
jgi:hypothetical protein